MCLLSSSWILYLVRISCVNMNENELLVLWGLNRFTCCVWFDRTGDAELVYNGAKMLTVHQSML